MVHRPRGAEHHAVRRGPRGLRRCGTGERRSSPAGAQRPSPNPPGEARGERTWRSEAPGPKRAGAHEASIEQHARARWLAGDGGHPRVKSRVHGARTQRWAVARCDAAAGVGRGPTRRLRRRPNRELSSAELTHAPTLATLQAHPARSITGAMTGVSAPNRACVQAVATATVVDARYAGVADRGLVG